MPNKRGGSSGVSSVVAPAAAPVAATTPAPAPQPTLTPQQRLAQLRQNINSLSDFASLPYDDKMDLIDAALKTPTPAGKPNTAFQKLSEYLGFDVTPPAVVTDAQLDAISGPDLYRTVNDRHGVTAVQMATDTMRKTDTPFYSDSGGSMYGRGLYFTTSLSGSTIYGDTSTSSRTIRAKLSPTAKVVKRSQLNSDVNKALAGNNRFSRMLKNLPTADQESIVAAFKGYDAISNHPGSSDNYHTIISRRALVFSSRIKGFPSTYGSRSWRGGSANINIV